MSDDIRNLIGAAFVDPAIAERLASDCKLKAPGALGPVLKAIKGLSRDGLEITILNVGERMPQVELADAGGLTALSALVVDADLESARKLVGLSASALPAMAGTEKTDVGHFFVSASTFFGESIGVSYLVKRLLERGTTGQLFGPWASGKTFVVIDLGCNIATEGVFAGQLCEKGVVLYLAGEGHGGIRRRVLAWANHHGKTADDLKLFHVSTNTILLDDSGLDVVIREAKHIQDAHSLPISLIVVDTMARHMAGNENSTEDGNRFVQAIDTIRATFPGSVALIVHHSGYGESSQSRGRGASTVPAAMDFIAQIDKGILTFTKQKDVELPAPIEFKLIPVQIGIDDEGEHITSCVVQFGERSAKHHPAMTVNEQIIVKVLKAAGGEMPVDTLRISFYRERRAKDSDAKTNTIKNAWHAARKSLAVKNVISDDDLTITLLSNHTKAQPSKYRHNPSENDGLTARANRQERHLSLKGDDDLTSPMTVPFADIELPGVLS